MKNSNGKRLLYFASALYMISLFLPGITYQSSQLGNPKYSICNTSVQSVNNGGICWSNIWRARLFGDAEPVACMSSGMHMPNVYNNPNHRFMSRDDVLQYCDGYDKPIADSQQGWKILLVGWLAIFDAGIFAWYTNILGGLAFIFAILKRYVSASVFSVSAFLVGLQSWSFHRLWLDESGSNFLIVDHLGVGYYFWEFSFVCVALYCIAQKKKTINAIELNTQNVP